MSSIEDKLAAPTAHADGVARAKLYGHLSHKGYIVTEKDELGPTKVLVNSMGLQEWHRDSVDFQKTGRQKARDFVMRLISQTDWKHG